MLAQVLVEKLAQGRQAEESEVELDYSKAMELVALMAEELVEAKPVYRTQKRQPLNWQTRLHWQQMYPYTQHQSFHFHTHNKFRHHMHPVVFVDKRSLY